MSAETLITFSFASVLLSLVPGPDNIFVLLQSALYGARSGLLITLGLCTGLVVHTSLVAAGVTAIFMVNQVAFTLLKFAGALYLLYLAVQAYRAQVSDFSSSSGPLRGGWQLYRRGIYMNLSNPKVGIFFLAFLPQFTNPSSGSISIQIMELGFIFIVSALLVFSAVALLAGKFSSYFRRSRRVQLLLNKLAAGVFTALAVRLGSSSL